MGKDGLENIEEQGGGGAGPPPPRITESLGSVEAPLLPGGLRSTQKSPRCAQGQVCLPLGELGAWSSPPLPWEWVQERKCHRPLPSVSPPVLQVPLTLPSRPSSLAEPQTLAGTCPSLPNGQLWPHDYVPDNGLSKGAVCNFWVVLSGRVLVALPLSPPPIAGIQMRWLDQEQPSWVMR